MTSAHDVVSQLLSPVQADVLRDAAANAWENGAPALATILGQAPEIADTNARLVMPDELLEEFAEPHIALTLSVSSADQQAMAYMVFSTATAALFFDTTADEPEDELRQTSVVVSTVVGQLIQGLNNTTFGDSPTGLVLSIDDVVPGAMEAILQEMDEPCMYLTAVLHAGRPLPVGFVLGGTFLDIVSAGFNAGFADGVDARSDERRVDTGHSPAEANTAAEVTGDAGFAPPSSDGGTSLPEPMVVRSTTFAEPPPPATGAEPRVERAPTPISAAPKAQKAQFGPIPEPAFAPAPSNIDLLADLQMRVSVELGRTRMSVTDVLALGAGSVVELDRLAGEPVDILVNDRIVARGEVVVVDENFGVRVVEVLARSRELGKAL